MKQLLITVIMMLIAVPAYAEANYSGTWEVAVREFGDKNYYLPMTDGRLIVEAQGRDYTAQFKQLKFSGSVQEDGLHLACEDRNKACGDLVLQISGDHLAGRGTLLAIPVTLQAKRPSVRPAHASTHDYDPQQFHNFYSPTIAPVLHIFPGDSVRTRTLDSRGQDRDGKPRAPRGNPLTGPFYVEGAMPGDTLVVHLDRIRTNRDTAYQSDLVALSALESGYIQDLAKYESGFTTWRIDAAANKASIVDPTNKLASYTVALSPMLGCIGVAPPHDESLSSGHLGVFGGNMDSPEIREGVTLYLPVFQPGALLYLGDGHAEQGDGELPGQGLETSMDVRFTVDLIPNNSLGQPRVEDKDFVMVIGTGVSLDAAMRNATTGMSRWLAGTYNLSPLEIAAVVGTSLKYEIAEVVDSEYDVVAKLPRDALSKIGKP